MKKIITLLVFCCTLSVFAQNNQPSYTKELLSIPLLDMPIPKQNLTTTAQANLTTFAPNTLPLVLDANTSANIPKQKLTLGQKLSLLKKLKHLKNDTPPNDVNVIGIVGFALAMAGLGFILVSSAATIFVTLSIIMLLGGLICSIIGLKHPKKGWAIAGLITSLAVILFVVLVLWLLILLLGMLS